MKNDSRWNDKLLDRLFGNVEDLTDEEVDLLHSLLTPGEDAKTVIHDVAAQSAQRYRARNKVPPKHVQAILAATGQQPLGLKGASESVLRKIIDSVASPFRSGVHDAVAPAFRNRTTATDEDQKILDSLVDELADDWPDEKDE